LPRTRHAAKRFSIVWQNACAEPIATHLDLGCIIVDELAVATEASSFQEVETRAVVGRPTSGGLVAITSSAAATAHVLETARGAPTAPAKLEIATDRKAR